MILVKDNKWNYTVNGKGIKDAIANNDFKKLKKETKNVTNEVKDILGENEELNNVYADIDEAPTDEDDYDFELEGRVNSCTPEKNLKAEWNNLLNQLYDVLDRMGVLVDCNGNCRQREFGEDCEYCDSCDVADSKINDKNLANSVLKKGDKVKLDETKFKETPIDPELLNDTYTVEAFWDKGEMVEEDQTEDNPNIRDLSGVVIKSKKTGKTRSVNRYQIKTCDSFGEDDVPQYKFWVELSGNGYNTNDSETYDSEEEATEAANEYINQLLTEWEDPNIAFDDFEIHIEEA